MTIVFQKKIYPEIRSRTEGTEKFASTKMERLQVLQSSPDNFVEEQLNKV